MKELNINDLIKNGDFKQVFDIKNGDFDLKSLMNSKEISELNINTKNSIIDVVNKLEKEGTKDIVFINDDNFSLKDFLFSNSIKIKK